MILLRSFMFFVLYIYVPYRVHLITYNYNLQNYFDLIIKTINKIKFHYLCILIFNEIR